MIHQNDTIAAISTPPGIGGIAVIRVSGPQSIEIVDSAWKGSDLKQATSHTVHLGKYYSTNGNLIDECVATLFLSPKSFTGEDVVELSVHGSSWIQREILNDLVKRGIRIANPGEFTQRAFLNGKLDLAQAEGVADLIASNSRAAHDMAITQTKGTFSQEFEKLRDKLVEFASLLELELDFSEEEVEFADRAALLSLCEGITEKVNKLISSFANGSVMKNGVPVVITGIPNAGKSSLLNLLVEEEKAIVTDIPGTTRDVIEAAAEFDGILYRFIDTAGLRETDDKIEEIGVERAIDSLKKAFIVVWLIDRTAPIAPQLELLNNFREKNPKKNLIVLINKTDTIYKFDESDPIGDKFSEEIVLPEAINFSTISIEGHQKFLSKLHEMATAGQNPGKDIIVTNARHYESLVKASSSLQNVSAGLLNGLSSDLIAQDIRETISHLSSITGSISSDTLLHSIFSRFCIGK